MKISIKKSKDPENDFDNYDLEMIINDVDLYEILENFENFLRGCGFVFDGRLIIEEPEHDDVHDVK